MAVSAGPSLGVFAVGGGLAAALVVIAALTIGKDDASVSSDDPASTTSETASLDANPDAAIIGDTTAALSGDGATPPQDGPTFDLVRVDPAGGTVIAGTSKPGLPVEILVDGQVVATATADNRGGFVALFDMPPSTEPQVITLQTKLDDGDSIASTASVLVMGREVIRLAEGETETDSGEADQAPAVIIATEDGVKVIQPVETATSNPDGTDTVTIDAITYDDDGEVVLSGRGANEQHVRVYVDGEPVKTEEIDEDGSWQLSLPEVAAGRYTLRVDELDSLGQVTSRVETPFQKEQADEARRVASVGSPESGEPDSLPTIDKITVQPGATLWAMAKANYGDGQLYIQIFHANKSTIRDPNLIYPGQIFELPE